MILVPRRNIWTPQPRWGHKRFQRGIICAFAPLSIPGGVLSLSGHSNTANRVNFDAKAEIRIHTDGNMHQRDNGVSWTQIDSTNDWVRPTSAIGAGNYYGRYTNLTGDTADAVSNVAEDTWFDLFTQNVIVGVVDTTPLGAITKSVTWDFEISESSSGPADVSASYTCTANRDDF